MSVHVLTEPGTPSCLLPLCQLLFMGSCTWDPPKYQSAIETWVLSPLWSQPKFFIREVTPANQVSLVTLPMGTSGGSASGYQAVWILDELNLQGLEDWPENECKDRRDSCWLDGNTCLPCSDLDLGKDVPCQTSDWADLSDAFKRALLAITPICMMIWRPTSRKILDIGAIWKLYSPWASTVVLVWKKDGSLRFYIDLMKLNNQTTNNTYFLPRIIETINSL